MFPLVICWYSIRGGWRLYFMSYNWSPVIGLPPCLVFFKNVHAFQTRTIHYRSMRMYLTLVSLGSAPATQLHPKKEKSFIQSSIHTPFFLFHQFFSFGRTYPFLYFLICGEAFSNLFLQIFSLFIDFIYFLFFCSWFLFLFLFLFLFSFLIHLKIFH